MDAKKEEMIEQGQDLESCIDILASELAGKSYDYIRDLLYKTAEVGGDKSMDAIVEVTIMSQA